MSSKCRTRGSIPGQSLLNECLMLGWDWNEWSVVPEQNHLHLLSCLSLFTSYWIKLFPHISTYISAFRDPFTMQQDFLERERERTQVRAVFIQWRMNPKHRMEQGNFQLGICCRLEERDWWWARNINFAVISFVGLSRDTMFTKSCDSAKTITEQCVFSLGLFRRSPRTSQI